MPDIFSDQLIQVARDLALAGVIYLAYKMARDASKASGRISALWKGGAISLAVAAFAALTLGNPSCTDGDPLFGGCSEYADNQYTPTSDQRGATFLYFALLFGLPVAMGAMSVQGHPLNPWAKPERKAP